MESAAESSSVEEQSLVERTLEIISHKEAGHPKHPDTFPSWTHQNAATEKRLNYWQIKMRIDLEKKEELELK